MLKLIKNEIEYQQALSRLNEIFFAQPGTQEGEELELLAFLIENYEKETSPVVEPADPIEVIKVRMQDLELKDKDLVDAIGNKSTVSLVLNKRRPLTLEMVRNLADKLGISIKLLSQRYELVSNNNEYA